MPSTSDKSTDKISLAQAVRWIETRADTPGASPCGIVSRASVDRLYEALKSGKIQATGASTVAVVHQFQRMSGTITISSSHASVFLTSAL
jgi:hypothetical protein